MYLRSLALATVALSCVSVFAQSGWQPAAGHTQISIWPGTAPGPALATDGPEADKSTAKEGLIAGKPLIRLGNVTAPTITYYAPQRGGPAGPRPAVVVFPGGGYHILAIDLEGTEVCDWLNSAGIACVLSSTACRILDRIPNLRRRCRMRSARWDWCGRRRRSGTLIRPRWACWASRRAGTWRRRPRPISISGRTRLLTPWTP